MKGRTRYTRQNIETSTYVQLPLFLYDEEFKDLSNDAKVLYAFLRRRHELSIKNGWYDKNDEVYLHFKREDMQNLLHKSKNTITKAMKDLKDFGLLEEVRQGHMKPNRIYLLCLDVKPNEIGAAKQVKNSDKSMIPKNYDSCVPSFGNHESQILTPSYKDSNNNKNSYNPVMSCQSSQLDLDRQDQTDPHTYEAQIKANINYSDFSNLHKPLVDEFIAIILDVLMSDGGTVRIGGETKPRSLVGSQLLKLGYDDIIHAINQFKGVTERITNKKQYILTILYNCKMERNSHDTNRSIFHHD